MSMGRNKGIYLSQEEVLKNLGLKTEELVNSIRGGKSGLFGGYPSWHDRESGFRELQRA